MPRPLWLRVKGLGCLGFKLWLACAGLLVIGSRLEDVLLHGVFGAFGFGGRELALYGFGLVALAALRLSAC